MLYEIHVDNNGDAEADVTYQFRFTTELADPDTFLYNTGPITSLGSANWNRRQTYQVTRVTGRQQHRPGRRPVLPAVQHRPAVHPGLRRAGRRPRCTGCNGGIKVFAGQRAEGFYVDLGAIFDLGDLRPFENLHAQYGMNVFSGPGTGVNATAQLNVHSIAIQVPTGDLLGRGPHGKVTDRGSVIGVWTTASRQRVQRVGRGHRLKRSAPARSHQVSRLGNPLINEVLIPLGQKDYWNTQPPHFDKAFASRVTHPELAGLLPALYPGVFPNLAKLVAAKTPRADLEAILLTGIPAGLVPGFQNYTGPVIADMLRLNTAIPASKSPNMLGVVGGDLAGFPNGRRVFDDVVTVELRAIAGAVAPARRQVIQAGRGGQPVTDGLTSASVPSGYLGSFPYLGVPYGGFTTPSS